LQPRRPRWRPRSRASASKTSPATAAAAALAAIPAATRLAYVCAKGYGERWHPNPAVLDAAAVCKTLGVPPELGASMVVAGGAALKLGCPWTAWGPRCDVDVFVLAVDGADQRLSAVASLLARYGRVVCRSRPSVLTWARTA
jgi:hypothetical protein